MRFLGTSPFSLDLYCTLRGFAGQLADVRSAIMEPVGYKSVKALNKYIPRSVLSHQVSAPAGSMHNANVSSSLPMQCQGSQASVVSLLWSTHQNQCLEVMTNSQVRKKHCGALSKTSGLPAFPSRTRFSGPGSPALTCPRFYHSPNSCGCTYVQRFGLRRQVSAADGARTQVEPEDLHPARLH